MLDVYKSSDGRERTVLDMCHSYRTVLHVRSVLLTLQLNDVHAQSDTLLLKWAYLHNHVGQPLLNTL